MPQNESEQIRELLRIVRDAGAVDDNNGAEDWTHSDKQIVITESAIAQILREARLSERKEIALDNYQGQTFSSSTNWHGKFEKFVENNERAIAALSNQKESGDE